MKVNTILKITGVLLATIFIAFIGFRIYVAAVFSGAFDKYYSKEDLIENYSQKTKEIQAVSDYIKSIMQPNCEVDIEFEDESQLSIFHVLNKDGGYNSNWDIAIENPKIDTLLSELKWTKMNLKILKAKLDAANCISVSNAEPVTIGFQRSGMGMYFYKLFDKPLTSSQKIKYNDGCTYIVLNDKVVLEYGGGVLGAQCFVQTKNKNN